MGPPPLEQKKSAVPWVLAAVAASVLLLVQPVLRLRGLDMSTPEAAGEAVGGIIGTLILPVLIAGLFAFSPSFRNARSFLQVYTWTTLFFAFVLFVNALNAP